ncbi:MAG: protease pro-enzyme activation domain-containing protein, partial [Terriglobales bacterium]
MRRVLSLSLVSSLIVLTLLTMGLTSFAVAQNSHTRTFFVPQSRITQPIDESNLIQLKGNTIYLADAKHDRGPVDPNTPTGHIIMLLQRSPEQAAALGALMDNQQDPKSPNYHNWLTAEEFGKNFGPTDSDLAKVTGWLQSKGFTIEEVTPGRTVIFFSGTVGQVQDAFHTSIHYLNVKGEQHTSNMSDPMVPAALAPVIGGFHRLNDFRPKPLLSKAGLRKVDNSTGRFVTIPGMKNPGPAPAITYSYSGYTDWDVTPQDWYTIYNANSALGAGVTGAGVTIAVIEETGLNGNTTAGYGSTDIQSFRAAFGLPAYPTSGGANATVGGINYMNGNSGASPACTAAATPTSTDEEGEALLDTEWAGTGAPNAIIDYVACATSGSGGIGAAGTDISATFIVNHLFSTVSSTSLSYGECEVAAGSSGATYYANLWQQGAAEGITHVISTGDAGANQCDQNEYVGYYTTADNALTVNVMSSSAYNIAAGGTDFSDVYQVKGGTPSTYWNTTNSSTFESALSYIPEVSWGAYCANPLFASELQANSTTVFGSTYTPIAICNNTNSINDGLYAAVGGGGGVSAYNSIPTYQSVYNGTGNQGNVSTTLRNTPDVAMFASSGWWSHALVYCQSDTGGSCVYSTPNDFAGVMVAGGTSFVAPPVNGLMGLIVQKYGRQGNANYTLYKLAAAEYGTTGSPSASIANCSGSNLGPSVGSSCIFRDIANDTPCLTGSTVCGTSTSGTSGSGALTSTEIGSDIANFCIRSSTNPCWRSASQSYGITSTGGTHPTTFNDAYRTAQGYDLATGLGSINITNLVNGWNSFSSTFTSTTAISANPTSITSPSGSTNLTGTVTATQRKGVPAGSVTFYIGSTSGTNLGTAPLTANACTGTAPNVVCTASAVLNVLGTQLASGSNSIIAYFPGDGANDGPSTSSATTVTYTPTVSTTTAVSSSANPSTYGQSVSFTATVTGNSPTGTVQFVVDSANFGSPVTLSGGSATSGSTSSLSAGSHTVSATYSGDSGNNGSTGTLAGGQTVSQASQAITFTTPAPASAEYGSSFTVAATGGASGNAIVYTSAGACSNSGATYTMTASSGNCSVIADQAGNSNYSAAPEVTETTAAAAANGGVSVATSGPTTYGQSATFTATITSDTGQVKGRKGAGKKP